MRGRISATFAVALLVLSATAALAQTVFSDFPVNGQISAFSISGGGSTSDSFTLASPATVGQVVFGAWVNPGDTVTSLTWAIGTTPYDTSLGTGVAAATSAYDFTNVDGFDVDTITFSIPSVSLPAGTYYLTLTNAVSASSQPDAYWDINDATGVDAWNNISGHVSAPGACYATVGISGSCAESFQLLGPTTGTTATLTSPLSFPNTPSGTTSAALAATLSNTGTTALNNIVPSITGANPSDFALSTGANACGATLAAGSSCSIYVTFTPATATSFSATLSVADSATGSPQTSTLTGTGTAPAATLSSPVAFPNTPSGTTSAALAATLSNTGNGALNNIVPSITGANPGDFALSTGANACGATLAAGSSCSIYVTFTPASATSFSATLSVADSATGSPQTSTLTGTGTAPAASLTPSLAFPSTTAGTTSSALAATLSNTGNGALNNIVPSITGANPSDFAISTGANACGATLAAGSSCSIYVTFTPATATSFSATLSVADNATGSPQTSTLTGTGTAAVSGAWPNGYNYEATFTVAAGKVPSAQTNFPALISGTFADFATTGNGGKVANTCTQTVGNNATSVPCDLIFTSDAAGTQLLSWEYETYTAATGTVNVWVNVPNLANGTVVYAWYGKASVTTSQSTPSATWSNYMAVYHLKENPAGGAPQLNDSTGNGNNATMEGPAVAGQQEPGEIDGSIGFTTNTWAGLSSSTAFDFERTDSFSLSGWIKIGSNTNGQILTKQTAGESNGWMLFQSPVGASPAIELGLVGTNAATLALARTPSISIGTWHYVVATYSGTSTTAGMNIYVDGVPQTLTSIANNLSTSIVNNVTPAINGRTNGYLESSDGMDELRVSAKGVVLTPAWVTASYNNESSPGTFFGVSTGLTNQGTAPVASLSSSLSFPNTASGTTSAALAATLSNTGNAPLNNIVPSITGANPSEFALSTGANACGATLAAGSSCSIYVTFTPATATSFSATLSVADSAMGSPQTSTLTGTGTAPAASLTPSLAFPSTTAGTTSSALAATLSNTGNGALNNIVPSITGANPSDFAISTGANACGATLAAGSSCSIYVTFTPATATSFSATLSVADSATGSPQTATLTGTGTAGGPTTWPNGYNYQATFTVAAGKVPSAQTNFPALISGTFADFATTANGGRVANTCSQTVGNNVTSVPCDLIFTSDAAGTQLLSWEYETYAATTGAVNVWVNVPNLANGSVVYAWYGQPSVTTPQSTPSATWSNYMAVYHMKENPAGGAPQLNDSTGNGNNATMQGAAVAGQQQPGEIDGSIGFTTSTWANLSSTSAFSFERTDSFSLSGWIKIGSNTNGQILTKQTAAENGGWMLFQNPVGASPAIELGLVGTNASTLALARTPSISIGTWHYVVATYSGTSTTAGMSIYVDGVPQTLTTISNNLSTTILNNVAPAINSRATGYLESSDGMDELRVSTKGVVLTPAWVTASYNNESSPATFFTVSTGLTNP